MNENKSILEVQETFENGKKIAEIYVGSNLTVQSELGEIINTMLPLFSRNDEINILSQRNTEVDISFIQIIIAAKKYSMEKEVPLHLNIHLSPVSKSLLEIAGLQKIFK